MPRIDLSVAMIFKNEMRCLERCLKSLQPLRERFSTELVMADTGSTDGSRAVAERYADVLFDFPWINDFSAARNAVLERCAGDWALIVDSDEWLDPNLVELEAIIHGSAAEGCDSAAILQRNYFTSELDYYNDFPTVRLLRMSERPRYVGAIHEVCELPGRQLQSCFSRATILHHDGYVMLNNDSASGRAKYARNVKLLRKELEREPDNPLRMLQLLESAVNEPDYNELLSRALAMKQRLPRKIWKEYGPIYYRLALSSSYDKESSAWEIWCAEAFSEFPRSCYMRVDGNYLRTIRAVRKNDWEAAFRFGSEYLRSCAEEKADSLRMAKTRLSSLTTYNDAAQNYIRINLAETYLKRREPERAATLMKAMVWSSADETQLDRSLSVLVWCYSESASGWEEALRGCWEGIGEETPSAARAAVRRRAFLAVGERVFRADFLHNGVLDLSIDPAKRPTWALFLPLAGMCVLGDAAALMDCDTAEKADALLARVENLRELPGKALLHALRLGVDFPPPGRTLSTDDMDALALKLKADAAFLRSAAVSAAFAAQTPQDILWARALTLAALQGFDGAAEEERWPLACAFARVQSLFLPLCYGGGALLQEEYLPVFYRFGLHFARALAIMEPSLLNPGFVPKERNARDAVAELRLALRTAPEFKSVVSCALNRL